jgi:hypothetical protein
MQLLRADVHLHPRDLALVSGNLVVAVRIVGHAAQQ